MIRHFENIKKKPLKIRQSGRYYQAGYYDRGKWILVKHLGTVEKIVKLIRSAEAMLGVTDQPERRIKNPG